MSSEIYGKLNRVARYARGRALPNSIGYCARYVRQAFQKEFGSSFKQTGSAYNYHSAGVLRGNGFIQIDPMTPIQNGDVYVINRHGKYVHGHIALWSNDAWVSDFVQKSSNIYGGKVVQYVLYRHKDALNGAKPFSGWVKRKYLQPGVPLKATGDAVPTLTSSETRTITRWKPPVSKTTRRTVKFSRKDINLAASMIDRNTGSTNLRKFVRNPQKSGLQYTELVNVKKEIDYLVNKAGGGMLASNTNGNLEPLSTWVSKTYDNVRQHGTSWVKKVLANQDEVEKILRKEIGVDKYGRIDVTTVNSLGYMGPFQVGYLAWKEGPAKVSSLGVSNHKALQTATKRKQPGSPADVNTMAEGIVHYWNTQMGYFTSAMKNLGLGFKLDSLPPSWEVLYALHNQGPSGFARYLSNGKMTGNQSTSAKNLLKNLRKRIM